jgi:putative transposase
MKFDPERHNRRSIRLKGYDYSLPGYYYVTICAQNRDCIFGDIIDKKMVLNEFGEIGKQILNELTVKYPNIEIGYYILMPNHLHAIISIGCRGGVPPPRGIGEFERQLPGDEETSPLEQNPTLGQIIAFYKYKTTKLTNELTGFPGIKIW